MNIRQTIKRLIRESYNEELMDMILDKIAKYGEKSLNPHEKSLLDRISKDKLNMEGDLDLIYDFLDYNIGELVGKSYNTVKLGRKISGIKYFDKNKNFIFDLEIASEVLGIRNEDYNLLADHELLEMLHDNFTLAEKDAKEVIKRWFEKETDNKISKIEFWISGD